VSAFAKTSDPVKAKLYKGLGICLALIVGSILAPSSLGYFTSLTLFCGIVGSIWVVGAYYRTKKYAQEHAAAQAEKRPNTAPPIWPPRRPDDWGRDIELEHRRAMQAYQWKAETMSKAGLTGSPGSPPTMPLIPSWEAHHAREQANDPLQIRWAQNEVGDWIKVVWGNLQMLPPGSSQAVKQSMKRADNGVWEWVTINDAETLEWQRGPFRYVEFVVNNPDGSKVSYQRPMGHPSHQPAPPPVEAAGEHGSSEWQTADDLAGIGAVHTGAGSPAPANNPPQGGGEHGSSEWQTADDLSGLGIVPPR
jgi:hypothetical protein